SCRVDRCITAAIAASPAATCIGNVRDAGNGTAWCPWPMWCPGSGRVPSAPSLIEYALAALAIGPGRATLCNDLVLQGLESLPLQAAQLGRMQGIVQLSNGGHIIAA